MLIVYIIIDKQWDYLNENCIIINTGKRKLWLKPNDLNELARCSFITITELRKKYFLSITNEDFELASDINREYQENLPVVLESSKRKRPFEEPLKGSVRNMNLFIMYKKIKKNVFMIYEY